ncbi:AI-2E family transporter [Leptolyngbya ohadii]|uniref:AI-2E family transporter n=1 Tax=Leptolyngbya ohadii TaxID=1962290 RepID=UPI000B59B282|nr:AI-2E family transporter [Leptolyngbya ohadii]
MSDRSLTRLLVSLASLVIIIAGLKAASSLLTPILLSLFIVLVCSPLVAWLRQKRVPNWLAYTIVTLGVIATGLLLIGFLGISVAQLSEALPQYRDSLDAQFALLQQQFDRFGIRQEDIFQLDLIEPGRIIQLTLSFFRGLLGTLSNTGLTLFIFIYMLVGASSFSRKLKRGLGNENPMLGRFTAFSRSISVYLLIKSWLGAMAAIGQTILLLFLGVDFAVLWGVLSFLFNFIPNIGYVIALIPPIIVTFLEFGLVKAIIVFIGYAVINNFFDMVIGPRYLGRGLDLSTLTTFLAVILWTWILGPIGAFLALPLTVLIKKLALEAFPDGQILATLLGADEEEETIDEKLR